MIGFGDFGARIAVSSNGTRRAIKPASVKRARKARQVHKIKRARKGSRKASQLFSGLPKPLRFMQKNVWSQNVVEELIPGAWLKALIRFDATYNRVNPKFLIKGKLTSDGIAHLKALKDEIKDDKKYLKIVRYALSKEYTPQGLASKFAVSVIRPPVSASKPQETKIAVAPNEALPAVVKKEEVAKSSEPKAISTEETAISGYGYVAMGNEAIEAQLYDGIEMYEEGALEGIVDTLKTTKGKVMLGIGGALALAGAWYVFYMKRDKGMRSLPKANADIKDFMDEE